MVVDALERQKWAAVRQALVRKRDSSNWEVKLAPPVNSVLPVSRRRLSALWEVFEK